MQHFWELFFEAATLTALAWALWRRHADFYNLRAQVAAEQAQSYYSRLVADSTFDGLVVTAMDGTVLWANPAYSRMTGFAQEDILGKHPMSFVVPAKDRRSEDEIRAFRYDVNDPEYSRPHLRRNCKANGDIFWNEITTNFRLGPDGEEIAILVCRDSTNLVDRQAELETARQGLEYAVRRDSLTGIANRMAMAERASQMIADGASQGSKIGILRIDLDRFKLVNDTFGHAAGDAVLQNVADVLRRSCRPDDFVARIGGDEFLALRAGVGSLKELLDFGNELGRVLARPFAWNGRTLACTASIGAALSDVDNPGLEDLLSRADLALYEAKRDRRAGVAGYDDDLHRRLSSEMALGRDLKAAVEAQQLAFAFQPLYDIEEDKVFGFETLVRWNHPQRGPMQPDQFLPLARDLGLMADIDMAAITAALSMKKTLETLGYLGLRFSLNASTEALAHPDYVPHLTKSVAAYGFDPAEISIEVLETVILDLGQQTVPQVGTIAQLYDLGFKTLLDDFGTGYASLAHLAQLRLSGVKIDRSLVQKIESDGPSARIVRAVCDLCAELGLAVVAEGVESPALGGLLHQMNCGILQGYAIAPPMCAPDVPDWIAGRAGHSGAAPSPMMERAV